MSTAIVFSRVLSQRLTGLASQGLRFCQNTSNAYQPCAATFPLLQSLTSHRQLHSTAPLQGVIELRMPALSPTMDTGTISKWHKKVGESISCNESIATIETDKASNEWESLDDGYLGKILYPEGSSDIKVNEVVALMVEEESEMGLVESYSVAGASSSTPPPPSPASSPPASASAASNYPSHTVWTLPALSPTMDAAQSFKGWNVSVGDEVKAGTILGVIETDKATMDWESQEEGYIAKLLLQEGQEMIPVGAGAIVVVEDKNDIPAFADYVYQQESQPSTPPTPTPQTQQTPQAPQAPAAPAAQPAQPAASGGSRVAVSPYAKKLASSYGLSIGDLVGSGIGGRIVGADVEKAKSSPGAARAPSAAPRPPAGGFVDLPTSGIRKTIAKRLTQSKQTVPHFYVTMEVDCTQLLNVRKQLNEVLAVEGSGAKISVNDMVLKATASALMSIPEVNSSWHETYIRQYADANLCVAVQTDTGLMVPVLPAVQNRGLADISRGVKDLAQRAKSGALTSADSTGGTFTVTNMGMYGVTHFQPIINPPQAGILAVGATQAKVVKAAGGGWEERQVMYATLSCDHRCVDGAVAAEWLKEFKGAIEAPLRALL